MVHNFSAKICCFPWLADIRSVSSINDDHLLTPAPVEWTVTLGGFHWICRSCSQIAHIRGYPDAHLATAMQHSWHSCPLASVLLVGEKSIPLTSWRNARWEDSIRDITSTVWIGCEKLMHVLENLHIELLSYTTLFSFYTIEKRKKKLLVWMTFSTDLVTKFH